MAALSVLEAGSADAHLPTAAELATTHGRLRHLLCPVAIASEATWRHDFAVAWAAHVRHHTDALLSTLGPAGLRGDDDGPIARRLLGSTTRAIDRLVARLDGPVDGATRAHLLSAVHELLHEHERLENELLALGPSPGDSRPDEPELDGPEPMSQNPMSRRG